MVTVVPASEPGVLGFALSGQLTRKDYQEVLLPPVRETIARGEQIRILAIVHDFRGLEPGALLGELMAAAKLGGGQDSPRSRFAVVTDTDWARHAIAAFGRFVPGDIRVFPSARRADAETWLASAGDP